MSDKKQETIADIVAQIRAAAHIQTADSPREVLNFADRIEAAHKSEVDELRRLLKVAEDALEKIDNMCDGDMCKFFENTHHCSACKYLDKCQTGVAHADLNEIRGKGANNGK